VHFASFLSRGFIIAKVVNSPERKQAKCTPALLTFDFQNLSIALKYFQLVKNYLDRTDGTSNI
jgi:hypothetical protein